MSLAKSIESFSSDYLLDSSENFAKFFEYYLEFVDANYAYEPEQKIDLDKLDSVFLDNFKRTILRNVPTSNNVTSMSDSEIADLAKTIISLGRTKGTNNAIKYLFRVLFKKEAELESGKLGQYQVKKPKDFEFIEVTSVGLPVVSDQSLNEISFSSFNKTTDESVNGFCRTIFWSDDRTETHLWVEDTKGDLSDGDVLHFPSSNKYVKIISTDKLQLDGWNNKSTRYITGDDMYASSPYNQKLYDIYPDYLAGFDYFDPNGKPAFTTVSFIGDDGNFLSCTLMLGSALTHDYSTTTVGEAIAATNQIGYGTLDSEFVLTFTAQGTGAYTHHFEFVDWDGDTFSANIEFIVANGRMVDMLINGISKLPEIGSVSFTYKVGMADWLLNGGSPVITYDELETRIRKLAIFTYIISSDISRTDYLDILRQTVLPAGYDVVSLFKSSESVINVSQKLTQMTVETPAVSIDYDVYGGDRGPILETHNIGISTTLAEQPMIRPKVAELFDSIYNRTRYSEQPYLVNSFGSITLGEMTSQEVRYNNGETVDLWNWLAPTTIITINNN